MSDADNGSLLATFLGAGGVPYKTVLADPSWPSKSTGDDAKRTKWLATNTKPRYKTMKPADIMALPVNDIADRDAMLVMWATWMHLALAMKVIEAWGFRYVTGIPWLKVCKPELVWGGPQYDVAAWLEKDPHAIRPIYGPGVWFQHCTELILLARRGHPFGKLGNPRPARKGIIIAPRGDEHSRKPEELQAWIDQKFPGPKLEMFARQPREGWSSWGDELSQPQG